MDHRNNSSKTYSLIKDMNRNELYLFYYKWCNRNMLLAGHNKFKFDIHIPTVQRELMKFEIEDLLHENPQD